MPRPGVLPSTQQTDKVERRIRRAAVVHFHTTLVRTAFEHGHWWVFVDDGEHERTFDAVDANTLSGFDFEEV